MVTTAIRPFLGDAANWTQPIPDYAVMQNALGAASASTQAVCKADVLGVATRSPIVVAFIIKGDDDNIHIGHSASLYPRGPLLPACPFNDRVVVVVGPDLATTVPVVLPDNTFQKRAATACHITAYLIGLHGHSAGLPAILWTGLHVIGDADTG